MSAESEEAEASNEVHGPCLFRPMVAELRTALAAEKERADKAEDQLPSEAFKLGCQKNMDDAKLEQQKLYHKNQSLACALEAAEEKVAGLAAALEYIDEHCIGSDNFPFQPEEVKAIQTALKYAAPLLAKSRAVERVVLYAQTIPFGLIVEALSKDSRNEMWVLDLTELDKRLAALAAIEAKKNTEGA